MKTSFLSLCLLLCLSPVFGQKIAGSWVGELDVPGAKIPLVFNIQANGTELKTTLDSPMQGVKDLATDKTTLTNNELTIDAKSIGIQYKGTFENEKINGTFFQGGASLPLVLSRKKEGEFEMKRPQEPKAPFDYNSEDITFVNPKDANTLAGTLTTPKNKKNFPVAILITGSGAENRNSEIFGHKPFWVIADDFAKKGIGVLRLDDRGVGGSSKGVKEDTSENFAGDINAAVEYLAAKGYTKIGLIGHSEGGMIAPMVAVQNKKVSFVISMAGPGIPVEDLLLLQSTAIAKAEGATDDDLKISNGMNKKLYGFVKNYSGNDLKTDIKTVIAEEFKKFPKNQLPPEDKMPDLINQQAMELTNPWFVYFIKYNPDAYWSKLKIPVLAINGTKDLQVLATENLAGIKKSLEKAGNKKFAVQSFDGLNHLFQTANTGSVSEYATIEETISPKVLDAMSSWILKL
ncbi:alpha/beta hydrolase family protein [Flavobacterium sp. XGLA_31]|uniref:alpha/beta hydrolase family protein n=1 Tax=Flavobacterium sp. XGLA_31 TaxID=3447666 RepID=UPI003F3A63D7